MTNTLTLSRHFSAPPAVIWRAWTQSDLARQWFTPKPVVTSKYLLEPFAGGRFASEMVIPDHGTVASEGCVILALPDTRLVWTNCFTAGFIPCTIGTGPADFAMTAEILLAPEDGGTRYTAHTHHANPQDAQKHADMGFHEGWGAAADQLEALTAAL